MNTIEIFAVSFILYFVLGAVFLMLFFPENLGPHEFMGNKKKLFLTLFLVGPAGWVGLVLWFFSSVSFHSAQKKFENWLNT